MLPNTNPPTYLQLLSDHTASIRVRRMLSSSFDVAAGVFQGSSLSLVLYTLFCRDISSATNFSTDLAQYADDTKCWATSRSASIANIRLQKYLNYLQKWMVKKNRTEPIQNSNHFLSSSICRHINSQSHTMGAKSLSLTFHHLSWNKVLPSTIIRPTHLPHCDDY